VGIVNESIVVHNPTRAFGIPYVPQMHHSFVRLKMDGRALRICNDALMTKTLTKLT